MTTLFISDLHLDGTRPDISAQFLDFLEREGRRAEALYILGDLFEAWIGDDDPDPDKRRVIQGLRSVTSAGVKTYFIQYRNADGRTRRLVIGIAKNAAKMRSHAQHIKEIT